MSAKARNLQILREHGIAVPAGFVVDESHFREATAPIRNAITSSLTDSRTIETLFESVSMPDRTRCWIDDNLAAMASADLYAVRSSGAVVARGAFLGEDGRTSSLAGQFESFLSVPPDQVYVAVRRCWASLFNSRSVSLFAADSDYVARSTMSVVIQEMVPAAASAVVMTVDPLSAGDVGGIEITLGPCEAIVSGAVNPDEILFSRHDGHVIRQVIGKKECRIVYAAFGASGSNGRAVAVHAEESALLSVSPEIIHALIRLGHRIEGIFGFPQDIEAVVTPTGQIVVTQARAITRLPALSAPFNLSFAA